MATPTITWLLIGVAAVITVVILMTNIYVDINIQNNGSIDNSYLAKYAAIQGYQGYLTNQADIMSNNQSSWWSIPNTISSTFNFLAVGLSGLQQLFSILNWMPGFFQNIFQTTLFPPIVWWFLQVSLLIGIPAIIYVAIRNSNRVP